LNSDREKLFRDIKEIRINKNMQRKTGNKRLPHIYKISIIVLLLVITGALFIPSTLLGADSFMPWHFDKNRAGDAGEIPLPEKNHECNDMLLGSLEKYFHEVSRVDGDRCPMEPTCSAYAIQAIRTHGFIIGYMMACDRIMRCGGNDTVWARTKGNRDSGFLDEVGQNDFWWYGLSAK